MLENNGVSRVGLLGHKEVPKGDLEKGFKYLSTETTLTTSTTCTTHSPPPERRGSCGSKLEF